MHRLSSYIWHDCQDEESLLSGPETTRFSSGVSGWDLIDGGDS